MPARTDSFDLGRLGLTAGQGRRLDLEVPIDPLSFGGQQYGVVPARATVRLDVSRTVGGGWALRLRFEVDLAGPCMRCLVEAAQATGVDAHEVHQAPDDEDLSSPYVSDQVLDLRGWARDALALAVPTQVLCRADCAGLCPVCGVDLNAVEGEHAHEAEPDPRWAALRGLKLE